MSFFKIFSPSKSKKRKPQRKTPPKAKAQARAKPSNQSKPPEPELIPREPSLWARLSSERKLDLTGIILAVVGILILLTLFASSRSALTADAILLLARTFGWGLYVLPIALFIFGIWLILRRNERLPALSLERTAGSILLFVWLLTIMHSIIAQPVMADAAALDGAGGGYIGGLFERLLFFGLGFGGAIIALMAWLLIALTMTLDITIQDLFRWIGTAFVQLKSLVLKPTPLPTSTGADAQTNDYTPLKETPAAPSISSLPPNLPTVTTTVSAPTIQWILPQINDILDAGNAPSVNEEFINQRGHLIEETLASFGAPAQVVEISRGPTITQFGVEPLFVETRGGRTRVRVSKIASLADDLALALAAPRIRIQAPVPGHSYVGIEVPNEEMMLVALRDVLENETFQRNKTALRFALGQDVAGHPIAANLEAMPHMLIAGTTGSGKSVCVNSILSCFLLNNTPDDLRLVLVDPKRVELTGYNGIPHLLSPVVVEVRSRREHAAMDDARDG